MKFKNYFVIFALFFTLMVIAGTVSAVSNDTIESVASETDFDEAISLTNDDEAIAIDNQDSKINTQINDNDNVSHSIDAGGDVLSENINLTDDKLAASGSSKSTLKIVNYTNFVKKGKTFYFYLADTKGNKIADKKLTITLDGKNYVKTTNAYGKAGISVKSSTDSASLKISFNGDNQYKAFSKTLKVYIDKYVAMSIGNLKLLTNGYLRVYLSGSKNYISNKTIKVTVAGKTFNKKTTAEGFIVFKPKVPTGTYNVVAQYGNYVVSKTVKCIAGNPASPLKQSVPMVKGVPDIDSMPSCYVMADNDGKYTLLKNQYKSTIKRDSQSLYLYGALSKYTFFQTKDCPTIKHIIKREKWNVIEQALNIKLVKKNRYSYWPSSITVSVKGKSLTYSEVRDVQNTEYTCGPTSASVCSQALRNYYSEKFFQKQANVVDGVNIPVLKSALDRNGFKTTYFYSVDSAVKELIKGGAALIAFLPNHYVSVIDISPDGKKILVSNSYGKYDVGGNSRVPTDWVSVKYFKSKFAGVGLVVKLNYKLSNSKYEQLVNVYSSMGSNWIRHNVNERIPDTAV